VQSIYCVPILLCHHYSSILGCQGYSKWTKKKNEPYSRGAYILEAGERENKQILKLII
jgi:hypothetical protein